MSDDTNTTSTEPIIPRSLKSAKPDLDVIVGRGDKKRTYRYHSVILASYSEYIDTMLSTPMREQETRTITFPDIEPHVWEKIMKMHVIGGYKFSILDADTLCDVLPVLDEYQFHDAIKTCDDALFEFFSNVSKGDILSPGSLRYSIKLSALSCQLDLPRSKNEAVKLAEQKLKAMPTSLDEDGIRTLLSLLQDKEEILRYAVATALGRKSSESKSMDEIKNLIEDQGFAERYKTRSLQIDEQEEIIRHLKIKFCSIDAAPPGLHFLVGKYVEARSGDETQGAMQYFYRRNYETEGGVGRRIIIETVDPFGEEWHISDVLSEEEEVAFANIASRRTGTNLLYKWESGFGSLLPPRYGWIATELADDPAPTLDYSITTGRGYYS